MVDTKVNTKKGFCGLVKTGKLVGYIYLPSGNVSAVIIFAKGGPSFGDNGDSKVWPSCSKKSVALFVPDYLGSGRSGGSQFSMESCLETIKLSETSLLKGRWLDTHIGTEFNLSFKQIYLVGSSWGGAIAPLYFSFNPKTVIDTLGLFYPVTEWDSKVKYQVKEEPDDVFLNSIKLGWSNYYQRFGHSDWIKIIQGKLPEYNPMNTVGQLSGKNVFITHGNKDKVVYWKRSYKYYQKLKDLGMNCNWLLLANCTHGGSAPAKAMECFLKWVK